MFGDIQKTAVFVVADQTCGQDLARQLFPQKEQCHFLSAPGPCVPEKMCALLKEGIDQAARDLGGIDLLFCDARPIFPRRTASAYSPEQWIDALRQTVYLCWKSVLYAMPHMSGRRDAAVVFITHADQRHPAADNALSAVSGAGIEMMTKLMASELASSGIRVVSVRADSSASNEEIGGVAAFLAGSDASYVTGAAFEVTGFIREKEAAL